MAKKKVWTEVEEFYVKSKVGSIDNADIAKSLGVTKKQLDSKIKELGLTDKQILVVEKKGLRGFAVTKDNGSVMMTPGRSLADDIEAGILPTELGGIAKVHPKNSNMDKYKVN